MTVKTAWVCVCAVEGGKGAKTDDRKTHRMIMTAPGARSEKPLSPLALTDEGADEGDRWASQKDHLSCVRGSMEREGDSDGGWLLLSSPFKLFLHTGHVSCCIHGEEEHTADDISSRLSTKDISSLFD